MEIINIIGASGHSKVVIEIAEAANVPIGNIYDGNPKIQSILDYKVEHQSNINLQSDRLHFIAIGNNKVRANVATRYKDLNFRALIHPNVLLSKRSVIGIGTAVMAGVSINSSVTIGKHCIINTNSSIDHDCEIGDFVHISPNVGLAGNVTVGEGTHVGIGAQVIQGITIGKWATIGAGAVIIRDVPDYAVVVGNPGKIIKYNNVI